MGGQEHHHHKKQGHDAAKDQAPTVGPSADDAGPWAAEEAEREEHVKRFHDLHARVISVSVDKDRTAITIASGSKQGVVDGMGGYLMGPGGAIADFMVDRVDERTAIAYVEASVDQVTAASGVVLNPSVKPEKKVHQNQKARIINLSIQGNLTEITIANGRLQGIQGGMKGVVVDASGRQLADFEVTETGPRFCKALVPLIPDQLQNADVILNPG